MFDEEPIPEPPGTSGPATAADLDAHDPPHPTGDLHTLPAQGPGPAPADDDQGELPEPPASPNELTGIDGDGGGVPLSYGRVPSSYVHAEDEHELPPPHIENKNRGQVVPQPTAIS